MGLSVISRDETILFVGVITEARRADLRLYSISES